MAALIGIELSPTICRIVDVDVRRSKSGLKPSQLRRFSILQQDTPEMTAALAGLRGRSAAVVVWGAPSDHRQVMVTDGNYAAMRREASRALAMAGVDTRGALIDIARAPFNAESDTRRRPVVVVLASSAAVQAAIAPLQRAGIDIKLIATPATALASLARVRRLLAENAATRSGDDTPRIDAYVAVEESATCIALLRDGALVAARELSWGFLERRYPRRREDMALRFADELSEFLATVGGSIQSVRQIAVCGGAPELRSLAADLTQRFGIEVESLDVPFGFANPLDAGTLQRCADLWMAWAVAVDQQAPLSLIHSRQLQAAHARFARAAVAAGIVVGVGLAWEAARCALRAAPAPPTHHAVSQRPVETLQHTASGAHENLR